MCIQRLQFSLVVVESNFKNGHLIVDNNLCSKSWYVDNKTIVTGTNIRETVPPCTHAFVVHLIIISRNQFVWASLMNSRWRDKVDFYMLTVRILLLQE